MSWRQQKHQRLCFHDWDYLTNFWCNNWWSIIEVVEGLCLHFIFLGHSTKASGCQKHFSCQGWHSFCWSAETPAIFYACFARNVVTDQMFGSAKLFGWTSTVRFGPNDRTFFCRTQNFFFVLHSMPMASFYIFVLLNDPHVRGVIISL